MEAAVNRDNCALGHRNWHPVLVPDMLHARGGRQTNELTWADAVDSRRVEPPIVVAEIAALRDVAL